MLSNFVKCLGLGLLGRAQPVIPPNLYSLISIYVNEHNSLGPQAIIMDNCIHKTDFKFKPNAKPFINPNQ